MKKYLWICTYLLMGALMAEVPQGLNENQSNHWLKVKERMEHTTDAFGLPIDAGIIKTVAALSFLGIGPIASCEGHLDWGCEYPWIKIVFPGCWELIYRADQIREQLHQIDEHDPEYEILSKKLEELFSSVDLKKKSEDQEVLQKLLDVFYQDQELCDETSLILHFHYLMPLGGLVEDLRLSPEEKKAKLALYQKEMERFTLFLIDQFKLTQ